MIVAQVAAPGGPADQQQPNEPHGDPSGDARDEAPERDDDCGHGSAEEGEGDEGTREPRRGHEQLSCQKTVAGTTVPGCIPVSNVRSAYAGGRGTASEPRSRGPSHVRPPRCTRPIPVSRASPAPFRGSRTRPSS